MSFLYNLLVFLILLLSFAVQEFVPAIEFAQHARMLLPPVFFFSASLSVPFPVMLCLALFTGLVWDARHLPYKPEKAKASIEHSVTSEFSEKIPGTGGSLSLGYSIILFGALGTLMQGLRPLFKRGRWEIPVFMVGIATSSWLLLEYLILSFIRGSFYFPHQMWTKVITDSLLAMFISPVMLYVLHSMSRILGYQVRHEGLTYHFHGH